MKKLLIVLVMIITMTGCLDQKYTEDESISKYTLDKYITILKQNNIDEMKCVPGKKAYRVYYFENKVPNDYPATIRLEGISGTYNVYFDVEYKRIIKSNLIEDIDGCFLELKRIIEVDKSWK
jgi:hypothetical protein